MKDLLRVGEVQLQGEGKQDDIARWQRWKLLPEVPTRMSLVGAAQTQSFPLLFLSVLEVGEHIQGHECIHRVRIVIHHFGPQDGTSEVLYSGPAYWADGRIGCEYGYMVPDDSSQENLTRDQLMHSPRTTFKIMGR